MSWDRSGQRIKFWYINDVEYCGTVELSRVKYGGAVQHRVLLDEPVEVYGRIAVYLLAEEFMISVDKSQD